METVVEVLKRISGPLSYTVNNAAGGRLVVRGLAQFITSQISQALEITPDPSVRESLSHLQRFFLDYERLSGQEKRERVVEARVFLDRLLTEIGPETLFPWEKPVGTLAGVGTAREKLFKKMGIATLEDLFYTLPFRYEDRSVIRKIAHLTGGENYCICGVIRKVTSPFFTPRRRVSVVGVVVEDGTGSLSAKWFNQPYLVRIFKKAQEDGQKVMLYGKVQVNPYMQFRREMESPHYEIVDEQGEEPIHTGRIVPIYHETAGLSARQIRRIIKGMLEEYGSAIPEILPPEIRERNHLLPLAEALSQIHFPFSSSALSFFNDGRSEPHRRVIFDEFFLLEVGLALRKREVACEEKGVQFTTEGDLLQKLLSLLPFHLTGAQKRVLAEITQDMRGTRPMNRLLQGDVGSGKTIIALCAMIIAAENGYQAALMVPTEILAEQHFFHIRSLVSQIGVQPVLLTSGMKKKDREEACQKIRDGSAQIAIGTHSLIQEKVSFRRLGVAVIDEQHKFGVMQRGHLARKGYRPDVLIMTATPIPRTLALSVYGDLDISVIDQLPPGRTPVETRVFSESHRAEVYEMIARAVKQGRQVYIVYPAVEESETGDLLAAVERAEYLQKNVFSEFRVGLIHGRVATQAKEEVMRDFVEKRVDILVATTVIEVGIDVPNATMILIEHAERFGLAQLHQLRGRVGRGEERSFCFLMVPGPLSAEARGRLEAMKKTTDGFIIAEEDLTIRGPGEFFGTRQSGLPELRVAHILRDAAILERAREEAFDFVKRDPELSLPRHREVRAALRRKWANKLEVVTIS